MRPNPKFSVFFFSCSALAVKIVPRLPEVLLAHPLKSNTREKGHGFQTSDQEVKGHLNVVTAV